MTRDEFLTTLRLLKVKSHDNEFRIKGFLLDYIKSPISDYVFLKGKIPYFLAKVIYEDGAKYNLHPDFNFEHPYEDKEHPTNKMYVTQIKITSIEELVLVINTIRDYPFINEWAIGNY